MSAHPGIRLVKPRRRRRSWPVSPTIPKLDVANLSTEQAERLTRIAGRSGVAWRPSQLALLARALRAFIALFVVSNKKGGAATPPGDWR